MWTDFASAPTRVAGRLRRARSAGADARAAVPEGADGLHPPLRRRPALALRRPARDGGRRGGLCRRRAVRDEAARRRHGRPASGRAAAVWTALALFIGLIAVESVLWRLSRLARLPHHGRHRRAARLDLFDYVNGQPMRYFAENLAGSLGQRITSTAGNFGALVNTLVWRILPPARRLRRRDPDLHHRRLAHDGGARRLRRPGHGRADPVRRAGSAVITAPMPIAPAPSRASSST